MIKTLLRAIMDIIIIRRLQDSSLTFVISNDISENNHELGFSLCKLKRELDPYSKQTKWVKSSVELRFTAHIIEK